MSLTQVKVLQGGTGASVRAIDNKFKDSVHVEDFGAVGNGTTNDATAFQNAINHVAGLGGGTVHFNKKHLIDSGITVKDYVTLKGPLDGGPDELRGATADSVTVGGESNIVNYDQMAGQLIINSSATITFRDGAGLCGALVMRKGLNLPFTPQTGSNPVFTGLAAFAGDALTVGGAGTTFKYLLILGFNKAIQSQGFERIGIDNVRGDCTNGIDIGTCLDIAYIQNCHFWPYTTTHQDGSETGTNNLAQYDGRQNLRGGIAYRFHTVGDWSKFTNCFSYGYYTGFTITNCNDVQLIGCGADYPSGTNEINNGTYDFTNTAQATYPTQATTTNTTNGYTSVGFIVNGNSHRTKLIGCQAAAQFLAYVVNTPDTNNKIAKTTFTDCSSWEIRSRHVFVRNGYTSYLNCSYTDSASLTETGIYIDSTADAATILSCHFGGINDPIFPQSTTTILHNTFDSCGSTDSVDPNATSTTTTLGAGSFIGNNSEAQNLVLRSSGNTAEGGEIKFQRAADTTNVYSIDVNGTGTSSVGALRFIDNVAGEERMRIRGDAGHEGKVGINDTGPTYRLQVSDVTNALFVKGGQTTAISQTFGASSTAIVKCENSEFAFGLSNAGPYPLYIQGRTHTNATKDIAINPLGGALLIGTTDTQGGHRLSVKADGAASLVLRRDTNNGAVANFMSGGSFVGSIGVTGSNTSYNTSSDYRLKENATAISDGITRIKTLKPYRFNFKSDPNTKVDGFFAHEVTAVPEAITGIKDEVDSDNNPIYQGIDQSKLVPLLVAAVQELVAKVETLEAK